MKKLLFAIVILVATGSLNTGWAQPGPEWGKDPAERQLMMRYLSFLPERIRSGDYDIAGFYLSQLLEKAPKAHVSLYVNGERYFRAKAKIVKDPAILKGIVDSLMTVQQLHIDNFGEANPDAVPHIYQNMALDYREYMFDDKQGMFDRFRTAIEMSPDAEFMLVYFNELTLAFKTDDITIDEYMTEYTRLSELLKGVGTEEQMGQLEGLLISSGAANCDNIENLYGPLIEVDPSNEDLLDKTVALLNNAKCTGSDFYAKVVVLLHEVRPTAQTALYLWAIYTERGDHAKAAQYQRQALELSTDPSQKVDILLQMAFSEIPRNNYRQVAAYANLALAIDSRNVAALFLLGNAYGNGSTACEDAFDRRTVFWLAVDRLEDARRYAQSNPNSGIKISDIDAQIARFRANYPSKEEVFFRALEVGSAYDVKCGWVTGRTTVRERP